MTRIERTSSELRPLRNKAMRLVRRIDEAEDIVTRIEDDITELETLALGKHKLPRGVKSQLAHAVSDAKKMLDSYIATSSGLTLFAHELKEIIEKEEVR